MVKFNELRITDDAEYLVIDAEVMDLPYYDKISITDVIIQDYRQVDFSGKRPRPGGKQKASPYLNKGEYEKDFSEFQDTLAHPDVENEYVPIIVFHDMVGRQIITHLDDRGIRRVRLYLSKEDLNLSTNAELEEGLFFVFIKTNIDKYLPEIEAEYNLPCERSNVYTIGITMDVKGVYRKSMCLIKDIIGECKIPKHFIDFILRWKAFKMAIQEGDYVTAIEFYENFILDKNKKMVKPYKSCSCNG